MHGYPKAETFL